VRFRTGEGRREWGKEEAVKALKAAEKRGYIDTGVDNDSGQRNVLVPAYTTTWFAKEEDDGDSSYFYKYEDAMADLKRPGSFDSANKYYTPNKVLFLGFDVGILDENGDVEVESENVSVNDVDKTLIPDYVGALVDSNAAIWYENFENSVANADALRKEVVDGLSESLIEEYKGLKIGLTSGLKYKRITLTDKEGNRVDSIGLRIADHPYNPKNNSVDEREGKFISLEFFENDPNSGRFGGKNSLQFDSSNTYEEVVEEVNDRIKRIINALRIEDIRFRAGGSGVEGYGAGKDTTSKIPVKIGNHKLTAEQREQLLKGEAVQLGSLVDKSGNLHANVQIKLNTNNNKVEMSKIKPETPKPQFKPTLKPISRHM
jgi:hypothetical protein